MVEPAPSMQRPTLMDLDQRAKLEVLLAVLSGLFLAALDQTVVGTALPRIVGDLHGADLYTWVVTAYLLTSTITVPIYGKFSDVFGRKAMLLLGIGLFLAGSALSGLSQNMTELIIFRALQGLGAGALFPVALAVIGDMFTPRERGRYQGLFGAVFGLSFIVGPFIGGFLTDHVSWHWVFYVNIPVGLVALAVIITQLPNVHLRTASVRDLDYLGIVVFTAGVVPVLIGLTNAGRQDSTGQLNSWTSMSVGGYVGIGVALLIVFLIIERFAREPIIPLDLFGNRTYSATNLATFMVAFGMFASVIFVPRYFQVVQGQSATESGYMIWPLLVGLIGASVGAGMLVSRLGRYRYLAIGAMAVNVAGMWLLTHLDTGTPLALLWFWLLLVGLGIGPAMSVFTVVVQNVAPRDRMGVATSTMTFLRQIGGSVGLAIAGTLFGQSLSDQLPGQLQAHQVPPQAAAAMRRVDITSPGDLGAQLRQAGVPSRSIDPLVSAVHDAFSAAVAHVFWLGVFGGIVAFLAVLAMREVPLRGMRRPAGDAGEDSAVDFPAVAV